MTETENVKVFQRAVGGCEAAGGYSYSFPSFKPKCIYIVGETESAVIGVERGAFLHPIRVVPRRACASSLYRDAAFIFLQNFLFARMGGGVKNEIRSLIS